MSRLVLLQRGDEMRCKLLEALPPFRQSDVLRVRAADGAITRVERGRVVLELERGLGRLVGPRYWSLALDALELVRRLRHPLTPPLFQGTAEALLAGVRDKYDAVVEVRQYGAFATGELADVERELVARYVPGGGRILDIGCGGGREAVAFARLGYRVLAIDIAPCMIEAARRSAARLGAAVDFRVQSVTAVDEAAGSFDAAFFAGSLHHLPGRELRVQTLARIRRALTPQGVLIVMVYYREPRGLLSRSRLVDGARAFVRRLGYRRMSEPGDGYMREVSPGSDPERLCFFHYYGGPPEVRAELEAAGFSTQEASRGWWICRSPGPCATVGAASSTSLTERSQR
jgi:SAM-dependent methyltransferase